MRNEGLNIFHIIIFPKKKKIFSKITTKRNLLGPDHILGNGMSNDRNEYNIFYGKWGRVSGTNMGSVFLFVFDHFNIDHYLTSNRSIVGKFYALHRYNS